MKTIRKQRLFILAAAIVALAAFLRLADFSDLTRFNADQVRDMRVIDAMRSGEFPLLGPKAGGTGFHLGPASYYIGYFSGSLFGYDPAGVALAVPILSILSLAPLFLILRRIFPVPLALFLAALSAASFYSVKYSRFAWNPNLVPFFMLSFLALLASLADPDAKERRLLRYILLGLAMGIGMQLHTTLLALMPAVFLLVHAYLLFRDRSLPWRQAAASFLIAIALQAPLIISDIRTGGENAGAFLSGIGTKTENASLPANIEATARFFSDGTSYALIGTESAAAGTVLIILGAIASAWIFRASEDRRRKEALLLLAGTVSLATLLFLPLGKELNVRFFIIISFLPLLLLGSLIDAMLSRGGRIRLAGLILAATGGILIAGCNLRTIADVYDLGHSQAEESAYGGISLGEAASIAGHIAGSGMPALILPFEFERSIEYAASRLGTAITGYGPKTRGAAGGFLISRTEGFDGVFQPYRCCFEERGRASFGRFTVAFLERRTGQPETRIGFITDVHAISTSKQDAVSGLSRKSGYGLGRFVKRMNESFHPSIAIEGGDFIDGTGRRGEKSVKDWKTAESIMDRLDAPHLHVVGNHDMRGLSGQEWLELSHSDMPYSATDIGDARIIILASNEDPSEAGSDEEDGLESYRLSDRQMRWFRQIIRDSWYRRTVVFVHVPILPDEEAGFVLGKGLDPIQAEEIRSLIDQYGALGVFSGHVERLRLSERGTARYFVLPGLWKSERKDVAWYDCFYEITVGEDVHVRMFYRKSASGSYRELAIPSPEFDRIMK